jgi:4'-phosphopantetheinyl transferase
MIRLYLFDLDHPPEPAPTLRRILDPAEAARADRFRRPRDRDRFVVGRAILRTLLGEACGEEPTDILFAYGPHGKPELAGDRPGRPTFGVTHSESLLAVALRPQGSIAVGVDAELVRPLRSPDGVAERVFTAREVEEVVPAALAEDWQPFHRYWTAKEAVLKALGTGLSLDPRAVSIRPGGGDAFEVAAAAGPIAGLPERGIWISAAMPVAPRSTGAAIVALAPVERHERVEVHALDSPTHAGPSPRPRDPSEAGA